MDWKTAATTVIITACLAAASAGNALGQEKKKAHPQKPSVSSVSPDNADVPEPKIDTTTRKAKIMLDQIDVVGNLAKPQAIFILPGSDPSVDGIQIDRSFLDAIFRPVEKDFFPQKGRRKFRGTIPW
ncbi:MAG TPA: hypothetical protein ENJ29_00915 [Bacteroidetes bacterium]|nr:hypothetical protein [Bacteroidota bacterium]